MPRRNSSGYDPFFRSTREDPVTDVPTESVQPTSAPVEDTPVSSAPSSINDRFSSMGRDKRAERKNNNKLSSAEEELTRMLTVSGMGLLEDMQNFELSPRDRANLDRLTQLRLGQAKGDLEFGLETAAGSATSGAAARGLPQGSLRNDLMARLSGPARQQYAQQTTQIRADQFAAELSLPRQDAGLRSQILASGSLTASQRLRLQQAAVRLQARQLDNQEESGFMSFLGGAGKIAGMALSYFNPPAGIALGAGSEFLFGKNSPGQQYNSSGYDYSFDDPYA